MFAREQRRSQTALPAIRRRVEPAAALDAGSGPVLLRKVCPCGGGCSGCAAEQQVEDNEAASSIQAKLEIGAVNDPLEYEADRVADHVTRMADPKPCACGGSCSECQSRSDASPPEILQRKPLSPAALDSTVLPAHVHAALQSPGGSLDAGTRQFFEPRFGHDFSSVRIHTGPGAAASAQSLNALAYTLGRDVVFNTGQYAPHTSHGQHILAHELTHVVQQSAAGGGVRPVARRVPICTDPPKVPMPSKAEFAADSDLNAIRQLAFTRQLDRDYLLRRGDRGTSVILVQRILLNTVCDSVNRDALAAELAEREYGKETVKAVLRFQQTHTDAAGRPLSRDGEVGPATLSAMDVILGLPPVGPARPPQKVGACYGIAKYGPGETSTHSNPFTGEINWVLSNFDVDKHFVKDEHRSFLESTVIPAINKTSPADQYLLSIVGEASTTASFGYNLALSSRRERCVAQALRDAGLDPSHKITFEFATGEWRGDIEQLAHGQNPELGIEDRAKRMVTITLDKKAKTCKRDVAAKDFYAGVACDSQDSVRITLAAEDPDNPIYREFVWFHEPWPDGCTMIPGEPPSFAAHFEWVKTATALRLTKRDPDDWLAPSDFDGDATFFGFGANQYLAHSIGKFPFPLFRIGLGGTWESDTCNKSAPQVYGQISPIGPVKCGRPDLPNGDCHFKEPEPCSDTYKMSPSKRFNGMLWGASATIDKGPELLKRFITPGVAAVGVEFATKDPGLDPPLSRWFGFLGAGFSGGGTGLDQFKIAFAQDQDADRPSRLAKNKPGSIFGDSDFDKIFFGKLEFFGGSNKIELTTDAGTFTFYVPFICNEESRTYHGEFQPAWRVQCPGKIDVPEVKEKECKDEKCSEKTRLAGHKKFTVKVGRATLASLPGIGRQLAEKYGCRVTAAFVNIQSEDGPDEKRIHREFIIILRDSDCVFTVGQGQESFDGYLERQLATETPDDIFADSDFAGGVRLDKDGDVNILSGFKWPVEFHLPGMFDPTCTDKRGALGIAVPVSAVDCGKTPDPINDTTTAPSHTDQCNEFRKKNTWVNVVLEDLRDNKYQNVLGATQSGQAIIPPDLYYQYLGQPGTVVQNALFVGRAPNPSGGPPIRFVAFADIRIVNVYPSHSMDIEFLKDLCAFDEHGNVVFIHAEGCIEGLGREGQVLPVSPHKVDVKKSAPPEPNVNTT
jgi:hypothetical protein